MVGRRIGERRLGYEWLYRKGIEPTRPAEVVCRSGGCGCVVRPFDEA